MTFWRTRMIAEGIRAAYRLIDRRLRWPVLGAQLASLLVVASVPVRFFSTAAALGLDFASVAILTVVFVIYMRRMNKILDELPTPPTREEIEEERRRRQEERRQRLVDDVVKDLRLMVEGDRTHHGGTH